MAEGTVKWFNNTKGFGFLEPHGGGEQEDIFVHYSSVKGDGFKTLLRGQSVSYTLVNGPKGLFASEVEAIGEILEAMDTMEAMAA